MLRKFHSCAVQSFKQKNAATSKKLRAPQKGKDAMHRNFRKTASFSGFQEQAPEVTGLHLLTGELVTGMVTYPDEIKKSLAHAGSYPAQQNNELFRTRTSLFRDQTLAQAKTLDQSRKLLLGASGVGKSILLSQLHVVAKLQGWAVFHISNAMGVVDGSTDHVPNGDFYLQPTLVKRWFERLLRVNPDLSEDAIKILQTGDATRLDDLFKQLESDNKKVLLSIDGFNSWAQQPLALNRNKSNEQIYHADLQLPRLVLEYLSGSRKLNGAVIAATSGRYQTNATINAAIGRQDAPAYAPITEYDPVLSAKLKDVEAVDVEYFSVDEARTWLEYLNKAGVAPEVSEQLVSERYAVSGGNPRFLLRSLVNYSF